MSRPSLRPVPDTPPRAILYLRQSTRREESISLEMQEASGRDHCERYGYEVVAVESDPGISGRTWNRPAVKRVMGAIENGDADVIVLWKWSRLSRSRRDWAIAVDRVDVAGGRIESATEPIDVATSAGRFARGVMAELAAFESERIGESWREVHARRIRNGRPINGKPRWGYVYNRDLKLHEPDPVTGPVLAHLYRRYVAGESVYALTRWLNEHGHRTCPGYSRETQFGNLWSDRTLRRVLDSGFAAGILIANGERHPGAHTPLIDEELWEAYQAARASRSSTRSSERSTYLLSGMMRCSCGSTMTGGQFGRNRQPKFRCKAGREYQLHPGGYVTMDYVHAELLAWLRKLAADVTGAAGAAATASATRERNNVTLLARELGNLQAQLTKATRSYLENIIPENAYREIRADLEAQVAVLEEKQLQAKVAARRAPAPQIARDLLTDWDILPVEQRRGALRQLLNHVKVTPGRPRGQIDIIPIWETTPDG